MIGQRFRQAREKQGYTRKDVVSLTSVGKTTIVRYEDDEIGNVSFENLTELANLYKVSTDYLLGITDDPRTYQDADLTPDEQELLEAYRRGDATKIMQLTVAKVPK